MKIYLLNETPFKGVENLILNEIKFYDFSVNLNDFDALICTSKNALKALEKAKIILNLNINLYAVGQSTAEFAKSLGFKNIKIPKAAYGKNLFNEFKEELKDKKCLYLRAKNIASALNLDLQNYGVNLSEIIVYENIFKKGEKKLEQPAIFIFTSPLSVENFLQNYFLRDDDKVIAIGQSTAKKLVNFKNIYICEKQNIKACVNLAKSLI